MRASGACLAARPTDEQFRAYQRLYDHFNQVLFAGRLPGVILNFSRQARTYGFFAPSRWESRRGVTHEISINPAHLASRDPEATCSTLVHEMVHLWQFEYGSPSRSGYHNREWADRMEAIGLMPSSTGAPGGARVGQNMTHYIVPGGPFDLAYRSMPEEYLLPWKCGEPTEEARRRPGGAGGDPRSRNKVKYTCPICRANVWGKPDLQVVCGECGTRFEVAA